MEKKKKSFLAYSHHHHHARQQSHSLTVPTLVLELLKVEIMPTGTVDGSTIARPPSFSTISSCCVAMTHCQYGFRSYQLPAPVKRVNSLAEQVDRRQQARRRFHGPRRRRAQQRRVCLVPPGRALFPAAVEFLLGEEGLVLVNVFCVVVGAVAVRVALVPAALWRGCTAARL